MAFPTFQASQDSNGSGSSISPILPTASAGDMEVIHVGYYGSGTGNLSTPAGWTKLIQVQTTSAFRPFVSAIFWRINPTAHGTIAGPTITFSPTGTQSSAVVHRISGANSIEATFAKFSSGSPNPPALSPTGGTQDYLWFAVRQGNDDGSVTLPTGYTSSGQRTISIPYIHTGRKTATAASEDPAAFTNVFTSNSTVFTVGIWFQSPSETISIDTRSFVATFQPVTVLQDETVAVDTLAVALTALPATTNARDTVAVDTLSLAVQLLDVTANAQTVVAIDTASFSLTTNEVVVNAAESLFVDTLSVTTNLLPTTIIEDEAIAVDLLAITTSFLDVAVSEQAVIEVDTASLSLTTYDVVINATDLTSVDLLQVTANLQPVTVIQDEVVTIDRLALALSLNAVVVNAKQKVAVDVAPITATTLPVNVKADDIVVIGVAPTALVFHELTVWFNDVVYMDTLPLTATLNAPTLRNLPYTMTVSTEHVRWEGSNGEAVLTTQQTTDLLALRELAEWTKPGIASEQWIRPD